MTYAPTFGWPLVLALLLLLAIAVAASLARRLGLDRALVVAAGRAVVQLVAVSALIAAVLARTWASLLFTLVMYTVAVGTAAGRGRTGARPAAEAAAAQLLVLIGLLAAEPTVVVVSQRLIADGRILPADLRDVLPTR